MPYSGRRRRTRRQASVIVLLVACALGVAMLAVALHELPRSAPGGSPRLAGPTPVATSGSPSAAVPDTPPVTSPSAGGTPAPPPHPRVPPPSPPGRPTPQPVLGVVNGGFESGSLSPWTCTGNLGRVVTSPVHSGRFALAGAVTNNDDVQCTETVRVEPRTEYTLSAWVRGAYVFIGVLGGGTGNPSMWSQGSNSYVPISVAFTTGPGTTTLTVFVHGWYAQGAYEVDDISLG